MKPRGEHYWRKKKDVMKARKVRDIWGKLTANLDEA